MRIGVAQIHTVAGAFDQTVERMVEQSRRAVEQGVELLVFPLAALAGVGALPFSDNPSFMADVADAVSDLTDRLACTALVPVPVDLCDPNGHIDVLLIEGGEARSLVRPAQARMSSPFGDGQGQAQGHGSIEVQERQSGREVSEFVHEGLRFAIALSQADLNQLDDYDYDDDVVLFVSGYPFAADDIASVLGASLNESRYIDDAKMMSSWMVGVGGVGGYGDQVFSGSSFVLSPSGELKALAPAFEETLLVCDVQPIHETQSPERDSDSLSLEVYDAPFHLWQAVSTGLRDFVHQQDKRDVALLLDGSLGSMVLLALASDALGPLHVHALVGSSAAKDAPACRELARKLHVDQIEGMGATGGLDARDLDELLLAAHAREHDAIVLSSLDKTALALGLGTGHVSAATLCPLGDVYRSDVLDMAHVRNTISPLFRRVALGLADEFSIRLDEGEAMRVDNEHTLESVDEILLGYVEYDRSLAELAEAGDTPRQVVEAVLRMVRASEPWRRAMPPVLVMSTHTLDEARFPLGYMWDDTRFDPPGYPFTAPPATSQEHVEELPEELADANLPQGMDLEGTLAMLRDLIEQGGLNPVDFMSPHPGNGQSGVDIDGGGMPGPPGWMTPFSEN